MVLNDGDICAIKECEGAPDHVSLEWGVARLSKWAAERELTMEEPGRLYVLGLAANERDPDGCHSGCFEDSCEHTHGARAERSNRGEEYDVDPVFS